MQSSSHGDRRYHPQPQRENQPGQDGQHAAKPSTVSSWGVTYLLQSAKRGWQRHKSPHVASLDAVNNCLDVTDAATSRLQERVDLRESATVGTIEVAFVAAAGAQNIVRFTLAGHPVRKFALIAESGRSAAELCQALDRQGVSVRGMEDLPDAVFLRGGDQRTAQALEVGIPNLSRPEVQAYIVRLLFQDSFHQFVSDLSEMFSHVQTHLPVPTLTPMRTSASGPPAAAAASAAASSASRGGSGDDGACGERQADAIAHDGNGGRDSGVLNAGRRGGVGRCSGEEVVAVGGGGRVGGGREERSQGEGSPVADSGTRGKGKGKAQANRGRGGRGRGRGRGRGGGRESRSAKPLGVGGSRRGGQQRNDGTRVTGPVGPIGGAQDVIRTTVESPARGGGVPPAPRPPRAKRPATEAEEAEAAASTPVARGQGSAGAAKGSTQQRPAPPAKRARTQQLQQQQQQQQQRQQRECGVGDGAQDFTQTLASGDGKVTNGSRSGGGGGGDKAPSRTGPVSRTGTGEAGTVVASARGVASSGRGPREGSGGQQLTGTGAKSGSGGGGGCDGGGAGQPKASGNGNHKTSARKKKKKKRTAGADASAATSSGSSATVAAACEAFASGAPRTGEGLGRNTAAPAATGGGRQRDTMPGVPPLLISPVTSSGRAPGLWTTLKRMWSEVNKHRSAWAFRKGVDPTTAPGYLDVVKHPIDLEGIRKRLDGPVVHYTSKAMLQDDLELMCRNAMLYNDKGTEYHRIAEDLLHFIESMFAR